MAFLIQASPRSTPPGTALISGARAEPPPTTQPCHCTSDPPDADTPSVSEGARGPAGGGACSVPTTHTHPVQASSLLTGQGKVPLSAARCPGRPLPARKEPACAMPTDSSAFSASWWQHAIKMQRLQNRLISDQTTGHLDAEAKPFQAQGLDGEFRA